MHIDSYGFTHRGGVRQQNEDAIFSSPSAGVWVVADGMGGHQGGEVASRIVCNSVERSVIAAGYNYTPQLLEQTIHTANQKILDHAAENMKSGTMGTTVVALHINDSDYSIFWAGDSRAYLLRSGQLHQLSRDHSQVEEMVERGLLHASEAESHPLSHIITRAVGVGSPLLIDRVDGKLVTDDIILLCSDGISKEFTSTEILNFIQEGNAEEACLAIQHAALVKKSKDNVSCIIVRIHAHCYAHHQFLQDEGDETIPVQR